MTAATSIVNAAIYTALSSNATLVAYVGGRFSPNIAPGGEVVPYVTYRYAFGGEMNASSKSAFEIFFDVVGVASTQPKAATAAGYIKDTLKKLMPTFTDGYVAWDYVAETYPMQNVIEVQGQQFWEIGSTYRFRGVISGD